MNDLVATQSNPGWWGRPRGIVPRSLLPTGTYRDKPPSRLVVGASDRLGVAVEYSTRAVFEPWFAEAGAVVNAAPDEPGSLLPTHQASTRSRRM